MDTKETLMLVGLVISSISALIAICAVFMARKSANAAHLSSQAAQLSSQLAQLSFESVHTNTLLGTLTVTEKLKSNSQVAKTKINMLNHGKEALTVTHFELSGAGVSGTSEYGYSVSSNNLIEQDTVWEATKSLELDCNLVVGVGTLHDLTVFVKIKGINSLHKEFHKTVQLKVKGLSNFNS
ncbi:hypothetical protein HYO05_23140 [Vibrio parahaemolyticus]|uniref:type II secretion system protein n=1 Tax=Vibrio parahaemolyticus TaxID=670 RepID=UPI00084B68BB|nr:hypothetical protein [Vibrio parahaemolyticus]EGQ8047238.1 hypothetical protein [Vibrio parahaemolyticus]EHH2867124.1 hypothetical protein [Vibrio parahaemolyticus]ELA9316682.1 hypothetical protein [Vibrio parahaemolyticus]MBM5036987.1 hypothetical protein [Vibrio parahaemolyticus]MBM5050660.1 hypothetical protein [Vibrio parahaemolyticus]